MRRSVLPRNCGAAILAACVSLVALVPTFDMGAHLLTNALRDSILPNVAERSPHGGRSLNLHFFHI